MHGEEVMYVIDLDGVVRRFKDYASSFFAVTKFHMYPD